MKPINIPTWRAVMVDVSAYASPDLLARCGGKLYQVSLYDASARTFCCEITPSHYLIPVDLVPEAYPKSEDESDRLHSDLLEAGAGSDPFYMHCSAVERLESREVAIDIDPEDMPADDGESLAMEAYAGNPRF